MFNKMFFFLYHGTICKYYLQKVSPGTNGRFLPLLDSIGRGRGMGLLSIVHPSVVCPCRITKIVSLNLKHGFISKFWLLLLLGHTLGQVFNF